MGKQTKRSRKFEKTGGVKGRLEKGTITNKGKLKRKRRENGAGVDEGKIRRAKETADEQLRLEQMKRAENNFTSKENLGDLDLESFFEKTVDELEQKSFDKNKDTSSTKGAGEEKKGIMQENTSLLKRSKKNCEKDAKDSSDSSDSEDEDADAAAERMQRQMDKLGKTDPEFQTFLKENEESLLDFEAEDDIIQGEVDEEEEEKEEGGTVVEVTDALLKRLDQGAFKSHGIKSLKKLLSIYKVACNLSDPDQVKVGTNGNRFHIASSKIFDKVMMMTLMQCHEEFSHHLVGKGSKKPGKNEQAPEDEEESDGGMEEKEDDSDADKNSPLHPKKLTASHRWVEIKSPLQSFFKSTLQVLMEGKDPEHLTYILKALGSYIPFLTPLPKMSQMLLRTLTNLWSAPLDSSEEYQVVRLNAFIRIRQMSITQPFPFIEDCLKKTYLAYAKRAKYGTSAGVTSVLPTLTFMGNCIVELYSLDFHSSYQHAFIYIRQLALHLRAAMQKKTPEAFQVVYCWQYMHCLKVWTAVLVQASKTAKDLEASRGSDADLLQSLIYPLTEVIQGVVRLVPTTRYLPLRLHCVRYMQQLASASEKFIPTTNILLEALDLKEITLKPKRDKSKAASRGFQLALAIKLPKENTLRSSEQLEACIGEIFLLLNREVDLYRYSPGFPEFTMVICQRLRKFSKTTRNGRWRAFSKGCIDLCERYSLSAKSDRSKLHEAPKDIKRLEALKPSSAPSMGERYDAAIAKEKRLEQAARPVLKPAVDESARNNGKQKRKLGPKGGDEQPSKSERVEKAKKLKVKKPISEREALEQEDEVAEGINWSDNEGIEDRSDSGSDDDSLSE